MTFKMIQQDPYFKNTLVHSLRPPYLLRFSFEMVVCNGLPHVEIFVADFVHKMNKDQQTLIFVHDRDSKYVHACWNIRWRQIAGIEHWSKSMIPSAMIYNNR